NGTNITPTTTALPKYKGKWTIAFDQPSTATQLRLIFHFATTNANAFDVYFDDIKIGPQNMAQAPPVGSQSVTVTGSWTANTTYSATERRVGNWAQYDVVVITSGAPTSANLAINLPSGRTIDVAGLPNNGAGG